MKQPETISVGTAARLIGASPDIVLRLIHEGKIRATRTGERGHWRIERASLSEYVETIRERYFGKKEQTNERP